MASLSFQSNLFTFLAIVGIGVSQFILDSLLESLLLLVKKQDPFGKPSAGLATGKKAKKHMLRERCKNMQ